MMLIADPFLEAPPWQQARTARSLVTSAVGSTVVSLSVLGLAVVAQSWWVAALVALGLALTLPGYLLLRAFGLSHRDMTRSPVWLVGTSLVALMILGLAVDLLGHAIGLARPLTALPLTLAVGIFCLLLSLLPGEGTPFTAAASVVRAIDLRATTALLVPALGAVATLRLNTGHGSAPPTLVLVTALGLVALGLWRARVWTDQRVAWLLASSTLALLLGFALRSDYVFGWDVSAEYGLVQATIADASWSTQHPGDAYGAMLSLTILPAFLHALTGLSGAVLLKLVFPALFCLFPVATFILLRRVFSARAALIGATLLLTQPQLTREMPALARQEIGLLLFIGIVAGMIDTHLRSWSRLLLLGVLTVGDVVAHYSTTYTLATIVAGAVLVQLLVGRWHGARMFDPRKWVVLLVAVLLGFTWYQGVTGSTGHTLNTVSQLLDSGLEILPSAEGENALQAYLRGPAPVAPITVPEYQTRVAADFARTKPWVVPVSTATDPQWGLKAVADAAPAAPSRLLALLALVGLIFSQLLIVVAVGGSVVLAVRRRIRGPLLDLAIVALPSIVLLALVRLSAAIADTYGQDRLYIQLMPLVAVPVLWSLVAMDRSARPWIERAGARWERFAPRFRAVLVGLVGAYLLLLVGLATGLQSLISGDHSPANLYNGGEHYTRFYVTTPEVSAAQWLERNQRFGDLTYADEYAQLRIFGYGEVKGLILNDVTPRTLDANSWVYAGRVNTVLDQTRVNYGGTQIIYAFPSDFISSQLGIAYTNGSAKVYHR